MLDSTDDSVVVRQVLQECLEHRMSDISEDCYCAGWLNNLEHSLFNLMLKGGGDFGAGSVSAKDADEMKVLAKLSDSWIIWDDGCKAIPLNEWIVKYNDAEAILAETYPSVSPVFCPEEW
jgi:hypothetical protein